MALPCVHIPIGLASREAARVFCRKLSAEPGCKVAPELMLYRIWMEWCAERREFRPLALPGPGAGSDFPEGYPWDRDNLSFLVEDAAGWSGQTGVLMKAALNSGVMARQNRDGRPGLVLTDFAEHNPHLLPGFKTIQQKGAEARNAVAKLEAIDRDAAKQMDVHRALELDLFDEKSPGTPTEDERRKCYALVMRMDRACDCPVRNSADYSAELMRLALIQVRTFGPDDITAVEAYLISKRSEPSVIRRPDRVIEHFADYLASSQAA